MVVAIVAATASSTWSGYGPMRVIDGDYSTYSHTDNTLDNYWQAEFAEYSAVRRVLLYPRQFCCKLVYTLYSALFRHEKMWVFNFKTF